MKTSELQGVALDWAVAKCEGVAVEYLNDGITRCLLQKPSGRYAPSTNWAQGGPIIEKENMKVFPNVGGRWSAQIRHTVNHPLVAHPVLDGWTNGAGDTPLIAAMRAYVASKLGDEVEIPEGLA